MIYVLTHPIKSLRQTRLGFLLVTSIEAFLLFAWTGTNLTCVWEMTGRPTWMFDFDCPLPQRTFVLFWWLFWTMPPLVGHMMADLGLMSRQTAKRIVWAYIGLTVVGIAYIQITQ